jgi:hypothetical protein
MLQFGFPAHALPSYSFSFYRRSVLSAAVCAAVVFWMTPRANANLIFSNALTENQSFSGTVTTPTATYTLGNPGTVVSDTTSGGVHFIYRQPDATSSPPSLDMYADQELSSLTQSIHGSSNSNTHIQLSTGADTGSVFSLLNGEHAGMGATTIASLQRIVSVTTDVLTPVRVAGNLTGDNGSSGESFTGGETLSGGYSGSLEIVVTEADNTVVYDSGPLILNASNPTGYLAFDTQTIVPLIGSTLTVLPAGDMLKVTTNLGSTTSVSASYTGSGNNNSTDPPSSTYGAERLAGANAAFDIIIPEPGSLAILTVGALGLLGFKRKK